MKSAISIGLAVVMLLGITACSMKTESETPASAVSNTNTLEVQKSLFAMDTYMSFKAYGNNADTALTDIMTLIADLEKTFSVTNVDSVVFKVNAGNGTAVAVPNTVVELVEQAQVISAQTNGAFDISIYPVLKAWGFTTEDYQVPTEETLTALLECVDYTWIDLDTENNTITLPENMQIDLGGIVKGYAGQKAAEILKAQGIESALLNMGGNIQTVGSKPDGSDWTVAVKDPEASSKYVGYIKVSDKAVVTSGAYERYFTDDNGNLWGHIMNPKTGYPAQSGLTSVTIVGSEGTLCDVLSTALFVMGLDEASAYWRSCGRFEAIFVTDDNEVYITEGLQGNFQTMGDYQAKTVHIISF